MAEQADWAMEFVTVENETDAAFIAFAAEPDIKAAAETFLSPHVRKLVAAIAYRCFVAGAKYAIGHCETAGHKSASQARREGMEAAMRAVAKLYDGPAHTYASENAELYRTQDATRADAIAAIQSLIDREAAQASDTTGER